jgi:hypothetical protein
VYDISVIATDTGGNATSHDVAITVLDANEIQSIQLVSATTTTGAGNDEATDTGDRVTFSVTFEDAVDVDFTSGSPTLALNIGGVPRYATYLEGDGVVNGDGTNTLLFRYIVTASDFDHDGISINTGAFDPNGSTMVTVGDPGMVVQTANTAVGPNTNARVDTIDLGGTLLIHGYQVEGLWYYHWDRNSNGVGDRGDIVDHNTLDAIFIWNSSFSSNNGPADTNNTYHFATINGVQVSLPNFGYGSDPYPINSPIPGTAVSGESTSGTANPTYNQLTAIWDAFNGTGVGYDESYGGTGGDLFGVPPGWAGESVSAAMPDNYRYWSATKSAMSASESHAYLNFSWGGAGPDPSPNPYDDTIKYYVALQVL